MNPFDSFSANFSQDRLDRFMLQQRMGGTKTAPKPTQQKKGRGGTLTSLISEGGALGGAAAGAAIGSAVPVVGTAIGGIIGAGVGAFGGRLAENKVRDDRLGVGDAAKEGAISAVLTGPLKALKYGGTLAKGLKAGSSLESALIAGADDATKFTLRGAIGKGVQNKATQLATKQFGLTDSYLANFTKRYREDAGKVVQRYGFSNVDDIGNQVTKQQEVFNSLVDGAGNVKRSTIDKKLTAIADDILKKAPSDQKAIGQKLLAERDHLVQQFGDEIPATALNTIRQEYDQLVNYSRKVANPTKHDVNKRVADGLRELIQDASGSKQLKETGMEISKLIDLSEEAAKRAPQVASRAASPLGFRNLLGGAVGAGIGGGTFGPAGAVAGMGATAFANSATGRRALAKGAKGVGDALVRTGGNGATPLSMAAKTAVTQPIEGALNGAPQTTQAQTLEDLLGGDQSQFLGANNTNPALNSAITAPTNNSFNMDGLYQNTQQQSSPYAKENLLADIQRDPRNAKEYIAYYQQLNEIFNPAPTGAIPKLNNTAIGTITDLQTGLDNLGGLEQRIGQSSANSPVLGNIRSLNPLDTDAKSLRAEIDRVKQVVGKALEGGVLRKEDEEKYARILPTINDTDEVAREKINAIRNDLQNKLQSYYVNQYQFGGGQPTSIEDALMQQGAYQ